MGIYDRDYYQDDELPPVRPWDGRTMVTTIIIINAVIFAVNFLLTSMVKVDGRIAQSGVVNYFLAVQAPGTLQNPLQWFQYLTYAFAHDRQNIFHILFNMASLYFLGRSVEAKLGRHEFLRFYLITAFVGGFLWSLLRLNSDVNANLIGASGATVGVSMLFVLYFPKATLYLYGALPVPAWLVGGMIIVFNVLGSQRGGGIAYDVHLIGVAMAFAYVGLKLNFSSLGNLVGSTKTWVRKKKSGLRVHRPKDDSSEDFKQTSKEDQEADRILEKIHQQGQDSLTARERRFMEKYSRHVRKRRTDD